MELVSSLAADIDVRWALKPSSRFLRYGIIEECLLRPRLPEWPCDKYAMDALKATLICLQVPSTCYHWEACVTEIWRMHALHGGHGGAPVMAAPAVAPGAPAGDALVPAAAAAAAAHGDGADGAVVAMAESAIVTRLKAENAQQAETIKTQAHEIRYLKTRISTLVCRRQSKKAAVSKDALVKAAREADTAEYKGRNQRWLTPHGAFNLVARRALSNISSRGIGFMLARDLHHSTMCRWEVRMRAALNSCSRQFFARAGYDMATHAVSGDTGWRVMLTQYSLGNLGWPVEGILGLTNWQSSVSLAFLVLSVFTAFSIGSPLVKVLL